jgi:hypothetical protein
MKIGDLVQTVPEYTPQMVNAEPDLGYVGLVVDEDRMYFAKGMSGDTVHLVQVLFPSGEMFWLDSDQIELLPKTDKKCPGQNASS